MSWAQVTKNPLNLLKASGTEKGAALVAGAIQIVSDVATLRTIAPAASRKIRTAGVLSAGDGGGGDWYAVTGAAAGTYTDNVGTVVLPTGGDGSAAWLRVGGGSGYMAAAWFGLDGVDDSVAVQAAVNAAQSVETGWTITAAGVVSRGVEIALNQLDNSGALVFANEVTIPNNKSIRFLSGCAWGTRIEFSGLGNYAFKVAGSAGGVFRAVEFRDLVFFKGGIEIEANVRGATNIDGCVFADIADYPIKGLGVSIVGGRVKGCKFSACAGGVSFDYIDCDNWVIEENAFTRSTKTDILLNTTGISIINNDFETRDTTASGEAWIHSKLGDLRIEKNRFGDESITGYAPPQYAILIGQTVPDSVTVSDIEIVHNTFKGTNGTPSATEAESVCRINAPISRFKFVENMFTENSDYYKAVIDENYIAALGNLAAASNGNIARDNQLPQTFTVPLFSNGGQGFGFVGAGDTSKNIIKNQLRTSNDLTSAVWLLTNAGILKDATGADGGVNSAFTLTKSAAGSASVRTQLMNAADNVDGYLTVGAWLKAGTQTRARIYIVNTTDNITQGSSETIELSEEWAFYSQVFTGIDPAKTYYCYIAIGANTAADNALIGSMLIYNPVAVNGAKMPADILPNKYSGGTNHAAQQYQSKVMGDMYHGYGAAAPASGRYEQGDIIWNTAPASGGYIGWSCVTGGSPGTWKGFGAIA